MIPEIGHFALILALCIALFQASISLVGASLGIQRWVAAAIPATLVQLLFLSVAYASLTWAFIDNDFSVLYGDFFTEIRALDRTPPSQRIALQIDRVK